MLKEGGEAMHFCFQFKIFVCIWYQDFLWECRDINWRRI